MMLFENYSLIVSAGNTWLYHMAVLGGGIVGTTLIYRDARAWALAPAVKRKIFFATFGGALMGCALPAFFAGEYLEAQILHYFLGPKTILGGLLFGFAGAALYKRLANITYDTSDAFVRGTCLMMAIGRLGCFAAHCCFGIPSVVWGMDFGDGLARFPIQLLESGIMFGLFLFFHVLHKQNIFPHRRLFIFFCVYGGLRFCLEFLREPIARTIFGIGFYQWLAVLLFAVGLFQIVKRTRLYPLTSHVPVS